MSDELAEYRRLKYGHRPVALGYVWRRISHAVTTQPTPVLTDLLAEEMTARRVRGMRGPTVWCRVWHLLNDRWGWQGFYGTFR